MANMTDELVFLETDRCCPVCGSTNYDSEGFDFDTDAVYIRCRCNECESAFTFGYWVKDAYINKDNYNKE